MKLLRLGALVPSVRRLAFSVALAATAALIAWLLLGSAEPSPPLKRAPAVTPAREQPVEPARRSLDPELVSFRELAPAYEHSSIST